MVVNNLVFTSGQIPLDTEGNIVSDDVKRANKTSARQFVSYLKKLVRFKLSCESNHFISDMNEFQQIK